MVKEFLSSFESTENLDGSAASRFVVWRAGLEIIRDNPILGVGPWAGSVLVPAYANLDVPRKELHNIYLEIGTGCGVFAAFAYFGSYWLSWFGVFRNRRRWAVNTNGTSDDNAIEIVGLSVLASLPGYFLASMFSAAALAESSYVMLALGASLSTWIHSSSTDSTE